MGQTREAVFAAHEDRFGYAPTGGREGPYGLAARIGQTYLLWGVVPSPLAVKVAENILSIYDGAAGAEATHAGATHEGAAHGGAPPNRIFYACYAGTHSSVLAASLHLGRVKDGDDLCDLPFFDRRESKDIGVPSASGSTPTGRRYMPWAQGGYQKGRKAIVRPDRGRLTQRQGLHMQRSRIPGLARQVRRVRVQAVQAGMARKADNRRRAWQADPRDAAGSQPLP
jgi:hypothetical protein